MRTVILLLLLLSPFSLSAQVQWTAHTIDSHLSGARDVFVIDLDRDGDLDVLSAAIDQDEITWWANDGQQVFTPHVVASSFDGAISVCAGDLDNDGDIDIAGAAHTANDIAIWINNGNESFTRITLDTNFAGAICVLITDLDDDGHQDLVAAASIDDRINWWRNTGDGSFSQRTITTGFSEVRDIVAADMDDDGDLDILGAASQSHEIAWWENNNTLNFVKHSVDLGFDGAYGVDAKDVNGDGTLDIIGASLLDDTIAWWQNNREDGFTKYVISPLGSATDVFGVDIDRDGDMDILASSLYTIMWLENDGEENFNSHTLSNSTDDTRKVIAADLDQDGDQDVLFAADQINQLGWAEQLGTPETVYIEVVSPNGGEAWRPGTTHEITWASDLISDVRIELYHGQQLASVIEEFTENDGSYSWTIPDDFPLSSGYRIVLNLTSGEGYDFSNNFFAVAPLPTISMQPFGSSISVPAEGGGVWYWMEITNPASEPGTCQLWTEIVLPGGTVYGPVMQTSVSLAAGSTYAPIRPFGQFVPAYAPLGSYTHVAHLGVFPALKLASDSFRFHKISDGEDDGLADTPGADVDWPVEGWDQLNKSASHVVQNAAEISGFQLHAAYPNPFNAATTISIVLPEPADLTVFIHNVAGQLVTTLANGQYVAGTHSLTFDASNLASGLYFIRATVPELLDQTQKVMLVR
jgi:FG-GAP-like repeat/Kre9/KNH-like N-terminal Ig-like domain/Secretion system C-terminal sorting domain